MSFLKQLRQRFLFTRRETEERVIEALRNERWTLHAQRVLLDKRESELIKLAAQINEAKVLFKRGEQIYQIALHVSALALDMAKDRPAIMQDFFRKVYRQLIDKREQTYGQ